MYLNRDYCMVGKCGRFLYTSSERANHAVIRLCRTCRPGNYFDTASLSKANNDGNKFELKKDSIIPFVSWLFWHK